jgi:lysophospholipase L1-like esterase
VKHSKIWLFLVVMACEFALFEAGLRLNAGSEAAPSFQRLFMTDPQVGFRLKPGARTRFKTSDFETDIVINSSGTRDDEIGPKAPNERRIVVLGDSLVMAIQVPLAETFCKRLQDRLNADPAAGPYRYRVINAGVQGYGPVQEWLFYQHVAAAFDADVVLIALFTGNDATEAADGASAVLPASDVAQAAPQTPSVQQAPIAPGWVRRVVRRSMVLQIVRLRATMLTDRFGPAAALERPLAVYLPTITPEIARGLKATRECVSRIAALAAERGAKTAVVLLPARFQVNDEDYGYLEAAARETGNTLVRNAATERFRAALAGLPVPVMDALPPLFDAPRRSELFFESTVHLTPRGHQVVADAIARFLLESHLVPPAGARPPVDADR